MFIKPKSEKPQQSKKEPLIKPKREKSKQPKMEPLKEFMTAEEMRQLSRDYVLEHEKLTVLSPEYVIEHGKEYEVEVDNGNNTPYLVCDMSDETEPPFTGLVYELYADGGYWYQFYENGFSTGKQAGVYPSGKLRMHGGEKGYFLWDEDGRILRINAKREGYVYIDIAADGKLRWLTMSDWCTGRY